MPLLEAAPDGVLVAERSGASVSDAVSTLMAVGEGLGLPRLRQAAKALKPADRFERLAIDRALERIDEVGRVLAAGVLSAPIGQRGDTAGWLNRNAAALTPNLAMREDMIDHGFTVAKLSVSASLIADLTRSME